MKVKIISGGQTGADLGGLIAGYKLGYETGGWAPKGFKTENGSNPLLKKFGLVEISSDRYEDRTFQNIIISRCTIIFNDENSAGSNLTEKLCKEWGKPYYKTSTRTVNIQDLRKWLLKMIKERPDAELLTINIAGNRESKAPGIQKRVEEILTKLFSNK